MLWFRRQGKRPYRKRLKVPETSAEPMSAYVERESPLVFRGVRLQIKVGRFDGLQDCNKLKWLNIENCRGVESVAPLKGLPLTYLNIKHCTNIRDLSPLKGMRIKELHIEGSGVGKARQAPAPRKKPPSQPRRKEGEGGKDVF